VSLASCSLPGLEEPLRCGTLFVPETRGSASTRSIPLRVVVVPALAAQPLGDPWVELVGGPGNAASDFARQFVEDLAYIRQSRDVVLIDQRGTGGSNPLYCPELSLHQISSFPARFPTDDVSRCRERLAANADLARYGSADAAEDLEAVRQWLGYSTLNLFGSSYGTRVALEYLRRYPQHTRSVMLWGVVPPDFRRPLGYPADGQQSMERLFDACRLDPTCARAYPDLAADWRDMLAQLDTQPVPLTFRNPVSGDSVSATITPGGMAQAIWSALAYPDRARRLPLVITAAARGDFTPLRALDIATDPPRRRYYNGMHLSVVCGEEVLQNTRAELEVAAVGSFMPAERGLAYLEACRRWNVPVADVALLAPVRSDVPTLIVSGAMDPITPPRWGAAVARTLPRSRHVVIPHLSHESSGLRGAECLDSLFARFLAHPDPANVATACVSSVQPPPFAVSRPTRR
jgi:pimeloyl-ACP methyl ester carboxylesterase